MKSSSVLSAVTSILAMIIFCSASIAETSATTYHACYAPGSELPERTMHERYQIIGNRWQQTAISTGNVALGQPLTLTWSLLPEGMMINGGYGEAASPSNLKARLLQLFGTESAYLAMFTKAFKGWSDNVGVRFVYESNDDGANLNEGFNGVVGVRGDIRIGGHRIDGDYGVLAYTSSPDAGDMVIDTADVYYTQQKDWMFQIVAHEVGHALGIAHTCPMSNTKLMEPLLSTSFVGPQFDDILAAMMLYGDRFEPNNQFGSAMNLGTLGTTGAISASTVSLSATSDVDFYRFTTSSSSLVTVVIQPTGQVYSQGAVGSGGGTGACGGTFPTVDANRVYNLQLDIYDPTGALMASSNTGALGASESLTFQASAGQTYYIRAFTTSAPPSSGMSVQMYSVNVSPSGPVAPASNSKSPSPTPTRSISRTPSITPSHSATPSPSPKPAGCQTSFCVK